MGEIRDARVRETLEALKRNDKALYEVVRARMAQAESAGMAFESMGGGAAAAPAMALETIVMSTGRPVLQILKNNVVLDGMPAEEAKLWRARLEKAGEALAGPIRSVGRIELSNHPDNIRWVGTGWLVSDDVVVTNRHVADVFGERRGQGFVFRSFGGRKLGAQIDFLEEFGNEQANEMKLREVLYIEDASGPDLAFLRVEPNGEMGKPIRLSGRTARAADQVAVIGYPARDWRIPNQEEMIRIFGDVYEKKRLSPGQIQEASGELVRHDCSTLGGNSGSVVLDLSTGEALGLHHAGTYGVANYAVPASVVADRLSRVGRREARSPGVSSSAVGTGAVSPVVAVAGATASASGGQSISVVVPIRVNIEVGAPVPAAASLSAPTAPAAVAASWGAQDAEEAAITMEGVAADYADREGYDAAFLGEGFEAPLPEIVKDKNQVLTFAGGESELKYLHYSVVMHSGRRQCFYSAVNVDGQLSKRTVRGPWKFDPRIPQAKQIKGECYGSPPKYSRGHMTRREDPAWGTQKQANLGSDDSMHVTNTTPQMQSFNGGIWLELENYALQNARKDDQRISVFTGPFFTAEDPVQYGVRIPKAFWKVIVFVHDESGELTATGYSISQEDHIPEQEFVFGEFGTHQRSLKWIERKAGLSFGELSRHDPKSRDNEAVSEAVETMAAPLAGLSGIRFR